MIRLLPGNHLTPWLLLACLLLAAVVALEWPWTPALSGIEHRLEQQSMQNLQDLAAMPGAGYVATSIRSYDEVLERPLFLEGRVPQEFPAAAVSAPAPQAPLNLQLEGVVIRPGTRIALVRDLGNRQLVKLQEGMQHQDWQVISVGTDGVLLRRDSREELLTLGDEGTARRR